MKINKKQRNFISVMIIMLMAASFLTGCDKDGGGKGKAPDIPGLEYEATVPLEYANQFKIYKYKGGYSYIDLVDSNKILVVPEGKKVPKKLKDDVLVIKQPLSDIYLVSTSVMALMDALDSLDDIKFVGTKKWYVENAIKAMKEGKWIYAGKYNAPDYELLINDKCQLAIENTMILHNPEVKEKMEELGIKTMVERSSYENNPLGRTEWIKVYGTMLGKEELADKIFNQQAEKIAKLKDLKNTGKTVAFFFVNSSGNVVTYKSKGYVPEMIRIAGGEYIFPELGNDDDSKLSTVNMSMEEFYNDAKDADIIIYNSSIMAELHNMDEFLALSPVLSDFKAVKEGNVWCTSKSMFQQTDKLGSIMQEMNAIFTDNKEEESKMQYIFKLN